MSKSYYFFKELVVFLKTENENEIDSIDCELVDVSYSHTMKELFLIVKCENGYENILLSDIDCINSYQALDEEDLEYLTSINDTHNILCIDTEYGFVDEIAGASYLEIDDFSQIEFCDYYGDWIKIEDLIK